MRVEAVRVRDLRRRRCRRQSKASKVCRRRRHRFPPLFLSLSRSLSLFIYLSFASETRNRSFAFRCPNFEMRKK